MSGTWCRQRTEMDVISGTSMGQVVERGGRQRMRQPRDKQAPFHRTIKENEYNQDHPLNGLSIVFNICILKF
jgi:hypothetical protein